MSASAIVSSLFLYALLPVLEAAAETPFYLVFGEFLGTVIGQVRLTLPWSIWVSGLSLFTSLVLIILTRGFSRGGLHLHWLTFLIALFGAVMVPVPAAVLAIILVNAAIWLTLCSAILVLVLVFLWLAFRLLSSVI